MQLNPYLQFNGQCEAAFKFYESCLGGKIVFKMTIGESPAAKMTPPERHNQILHIRLMVGDKVLMGSDTPPEYYEKPQGFSVTLGVDTPAEAERIFNALAEEGTVRMPLEETFWAQRFGMLSDQFGTPWMINCEKAA
jgi:PhnB protein